MKRAPYPSTSTSLETYLSEINRFPLLTVDEEQRLAREYKQLGETRAAHRLITANLRFVVKVAYEYRSYGFRMADLIQEGNIGLMKAVQKFDADKGIRLISYAVWWIRAYIQNYILRSWSLVKLGTTQAQRKLFFSLARTKRELEKLNGAGAPKPDAAEIATAGELDFDSNEQCVIDGRRQENVVWKQAPPAGSYTVRVDAFSLCGEVAARWRVRVFLGGTLLGQARGQMTESDTRGDHVAGAGLTVLSFTL